MVLAGVASIRDNLRFINILSHYLHTQIELFAHMGVSLAEINKKIIVFTAYWQTINSSLWILYGWVYTCDSYTFNIPNGKFELWKTDLLKLQIYLILILLKLEPNMATMCTFAINKRSCAYKQYNWLDNYFAKTQCRH